MMHLQLTVRGIEWTRGERMLGVPTVGDRIAQTVVRHLLRTLSCFTRILLFYKLENTRLLSCSLLL